MRTIRWKVSGTKIRRGFQTDRSFLENEDDELLGGKYLHHSNYKQTFVT